MAVGGGITISILFVAILGLALTLALLPSRDGEAGGLGRWLTQPGKAAGGVISGVLSDPPGLVVDLKRVRFNGIGRITLVDIEVADADGVWLEAGRVDVRWRPGELLSRVLHVDRVDSPDLILHRLPEADDTPDPAGWAVDLAWPRPPIAIHVAAVTAEIRMAGTPDPFALEGALDLADGRVRADLALEPDSGRGGHVHVRLDAREEDNSLALDVDAAASPDGIFARMAGLGGGGGQFRLTGDGALDQWSGDIEAVLPTGDRVSGTIARLDPGSVADDEGRIGYGLDGQLIVTEAGLLSLSAPPELAAALAGSRDLSVRADFDTPTPGRVVLTRADLDLDGGGIHLLVDMDPVNAPGVLTAELNVTDPAPFASLLEGGAFDTAHVDGAVRLAPHAAFDGNFRFDGLAVENDTADAGLDTLEGRLVLGTEAGIHLDASGLARGIRGGPAEDDPLSLDRLDWALSASLPEGTSEVTIDRMRLSARGINARARGTIGTDTGAIGIDGDIRLDDLAVLWDGFESGRYAGDFAVTSGPDGLRVGLDGAVEDLDPGDPRLAALIGNSSIRLNFQQGNRPHGAVSSAFDLRFDAPALNLAVDGTLDGAERIYADAALRF
ncbi:MAG: hypothetical protein WEB93_02455, partial [Sphingomonadales bacterium]